MQGLRTALAAAALIALPLPAAADIVGFSFGAYGWQANPEGFVQDRDAAISLDADIEDDLGLEKDSPIVVWAALEHPLPVLPNLKLQYTPLKLEGSGTVDGSFTFDGEVFAANQDVDSQLDLTQLDAILYYEVLDNFLSLDVGINIKLLDGELMIRNRDTGETVREDLQAPIPMLYFNAGLDLPGSLLLGLEASGIGYSGNRLTDIKATVAWQIAMLSIEGGYRAQQLRLDDLDGIDADIKVRGPFIGASLDF